ncbi:MAG: hypothetical protein QXD43_04060 [Candidatus Aenigmatarchaeota archaeon]
MTQYKLNKEIADLAERVEMARVTTILRKLINNEISKEEAINKIYIERS